MFNDLEVEVGMFFCVIIDYGEQLVIVIDKIDDQVIIDGNYLLVGIILLFEVDVIEVCELMVDELQYGYVYGLGGCGYNY